MHRFVSEPLTVGVQDRPELDAISRADLVFYGLDHSGPSYEGRVYLNRLDAGLDTAREADQGYAGSFFVFGHGRCYGDDGHCDPTQRTTDEFDLRPTHPLAPWTATVIVTDALRRVGPDDVTVTVVAVDHRTKDAAPSEALTVDTVRLLLYEP